MKDKANRILDDLNNNNENTNISEDLKNDKEYQEILERIHDLETLTDEEIIEKFGLVGDEDYWIEEQLEDLPKTYEFLK
jgi:DNA-binding Lrp family transcriptional regulator